MDFKLGILVTDDIAPELQHFGDYPQMFSTLLSKQNPGIAFINYDVVAGQYPADKDECDAYLITGSKADSYADTPWIVALREYVRQLYEAEKPFVGICFGHQLIALALGGDAGKSEKGWGIGVHQYQFEDHPDWLEADNTFQMLAMHQDQVKQLPPDATLLASSEFCPFAAYSIKNKVLCFQAHPEFVADYSRGLIARRHHLIPEQTRQKAEASFSQPLDHDKVGMWINAFIEDALAGK